jgi:hypothetical protein
LPDGDAWRVHTRHATSRALTRDQLAGLVTESGFSATSWHDPETSGFFQPVLTARRRPLGLSCGGAVTFP